MVWFFFFVLYIVLQDMKRKAKLLYTVTQRFRIPEIKNETNPLSHLTKSPQAHVLCSLWSYFPVFSVVLSWMHHVMGFCCSPWEAVAEPRGLTIRALWMILFENCAESPKLLCCFSGVRAARSLQLWLQDLQIRLPCLKYTREELAQNMDVIHAVCFVF